MTRLSRCAAVAAVATFLLIVLGGVARATPGACGGTWPQCGGTWLPPLEPAALVGWLHRAVSASVGLLVLAVALLAFGTPAAGRRVRLLAGGAFLVVLAQSLLGGVSVRLGWPEWSTTPHLAAALVAFGLTLAAATEAALTAGRPAWLTRAAGAPGTGPWPVRLAQLGALAALGLILTGATTGATAVAVACTTWPLCPDNAVHAAAGLGSGLAPQLAVLANVAVAALAAAAVLRGGASPFVRGLAVGAAGLAALQWGLGAAARDGAAWAGPASLATLTLLLAAMVAVVALAAGEPAVAAAGTAGTVAGGPPAVAAPGAGLPSGLAKARQTFQDYAALTKPGILTLLLTTTLCAMLIAAAGVPPFGLIVATMVGGVLAAGGANVLNCYIDRDIDSQMPRTRHRATVAGRIGPWTALGYGLTLTVLAVVVYGVFVNWLAAWLALAGNVYYVLIYTRWLKRTTPQNIVIGGAAGAVPPLVGWAAVTGSLAPLAWGLFLIIFFWTPPHFWALALLKQGEYGRAAVPMLPNVAGERETRKQIVVYSVVLAATCLALVPFGLGWVYLVGAAVLNALFLGLAIRLWREPSKRAARQLFFYSLWYLALIFAVAVLDRLILG